ncbi:DUF2868 domain-containing protein [Parahaliea mediterranea]|uniref:DUF2868 domain-containing protein n=1 Tax=Parahaliea mediterranea TaxID=651086 RepID=A0A939IJV1_9GAMM|nr:DUF2868 domain-containing protein [Parahaliea mediterranea]MBN7798074.1 DUF2868 domain-containing protein [Parahaliea mediterranea]
MKARPDLRDIYRLADQLERDRERPLDELKQRDHAIAADCRHGADPELLLHWLDRLAPRGDRDSREGSVALYLSRLLCPLLGFGAMAGFLLGSARGLVNVLILLGVFVVLQVLASLGAAVGLLRTASGHVPAALPASPARWVAGRSLPDDRYLREAGGVLRLLFLRFGQEWGALFTLGALLAFVLVPALSDFSFVWGSTFPLGEGVMQGLVDTLAAPWSTLLPGATVPPEVVANSRYHPALVDLDRVGIESMRGWWGFLFMCLLGYALLPRILLWLVARWIAPRLLRRTFLGYPGAELVLSRMRQPLVRTQARAGEGADDKGGAAATAPAHDVTLDGKLLLLDWGDALAGEPPSGFEELLAVGAGNSVVIGRGTLEEDRRRLHDRSGAGFDHLLVVVKSWEPPMAELADLLETLRGIPRCTLYLLPLPGKAVPHRKVEDWRAFTRGLPFAAVDVRLLNRVAAA